MLLSYHQTAKSEYLRESAAWWAPPLLLPNKKGLVPECFLFDFKVYTVCCFFFRDEWSFNLGYLLIDYKRNILTWFFVRNERSWWGRNNEIFIKFFFFFFFKFFLPYIPLGGWNQQNQTTQLSVLSRWYQVEKFSADKSFELVWALITDAPRQLIHKYAGK